ncbi:tRNA (N(6)-L-threonylcarbamoyladenosine(37)-C(2))-methylthiotransferase MtaB [Maridesulfovibrio ferrireducens]|uniref:tRNA (N(6)-L-threonylcarbamoyladenosine(37)-C(2))- methylthiotransferase MtaB n=1 Tax=Maridesulfovibrio ferrireducens TaxID=246191 RepID=UPI001A344652|nr:tRNA (N(6)-L-threonylcarbamoyladenosine(37)-C(2))-methylthiotransferase MtaB [Maridesulfovibrio ferrireducens]MBI9112136.1 tRNA (N(6)-L-threonylcarbamoyladenosine(37)-C(2))-methylthiotransferase MtaB [Maridesulfovibrio ferrireducens]
MKKFWITTLGCKINQYESESIRQRWEQMGFEQAANDVEAHEVVINSCAVTASALRDLRQLVRSINRRNPEADIIITGCAAQVFAGELAELPGVSEVIPQDHKADLLKLDKLHDSEEKVENSDGVTIFQPFEIKDYQRARAVVKVQDGCSHRCTYCIVPITRGPSVSRKIEDILSEIQRLLDAGFREMVISGINLSHYGREFKDRPDFWDLMERIEKEFGSEWGGRARLRISSLEPGQLKDRAFEVFSSSKLICPQLHLSLQSGDYSVLKRMGRGHYKPQDALTFVEELTKIWPVFGLGADILTAFPGETEEEFNNTFEFCQKLPLSYAHVFPYSVRPGTVAAKMKGQLSGFIKKERGAKLRELVEEKKAEFLNKILGLNSLKVLFQDKNKGICEFYSTCELENGFEGAVPRELVKVVPIKILKDKLLVRILEPEC